MKFINYIKINFIVRFSLYLFTCLSLRQKAFSYEYFSTFSISYCLFRYNSINVSSLLYFLSSIFVIFSIMNQLYLLSYLFCVIFIRTFIFLLGVCVCYLGKKVWGIWKRYFVIEFSPQMGFITKNLTNNLYYYLANALSSVSSTLLYLYPCHRLKDQVRDNKSYFIGMAISLTHPFAVTLLTCLSRVNLYPSQGSSYHFSSSPLFLSSMRSNFSYPSTEVFSSIIILDLKSSG